MTVQNKGIKTVKPIEEKRHPIRLSTILIHILLIILVFINIFPLYWMLTFSLKSGKNPVNEIQGYSYPMDMTRWEEIRTGVTKALTDEKTKGESTDARWEKVEHVIIDVLGDVSDIEWTAMRGAVQSSLENRIKNDKTVKELPADEQTEYRQTVVSEFENAWEDIRTGFTGIEGIFTPGKTDEDWDRIKASAEGIVASMLPSNTTGFTFTSNKWKRMKSAVDHIVEMQEAGIDDPWEEVRTTVVSVMDQLTQPAGETEADPWETFKGSIATVMGDQKDSLDQPRSVYVPPNLVGLPKQWTWSNYESAMKTGNMGQYFLNSLVVSVSAIAITMIAAFMATYAMTRLVWKGRKMMNKFFMLGLTIPIHAAIVPVYIILSRLGWLNTYIALIVPYAAFSLSMAILISVGFMGDIPYDLDEAAFLDGCGVWGIFFRVILPLMVPAISTVGIYTFLQCWNELLFATIFVSDGLYRTLPVGVQQLFGQYTVDWGPIGAALSIATIPTLIVYIALSKRIQAGFIAGAVKG